MRLTQADHERVTAAVAEAERSSSGEIVTIVAARSDAYHDVGLHYAVLAMLLVPAALAVTPDPVKIATEGALWGSIKAHGLLPDTVILSDDAGQFALDRHALCWVHAERLVHKLIPHNDLRTLERRLESFRTPHRRVWYAADGLYFGMPLVNWVGWLLTSALIVGGYATFLGGLGGRARRAPMLYAANVLFPVFICLAYGVPWAGLAGLAALAVPFLLLRLRSHPRSEAVPA